MMSSARRPAPHHLCGTVAASSPSVQVCTSSYEGQLYIAVLYIGGSYSHLFTMVRSSLGRAVLKDSGGLAEEYPFCAISVPDFL